jgi:hypothetical protein
MPSLLVVHGELQISALGIRQLPHGVQMGVCYPQLKDSDLTVLNFT